MSTQDTLPHEIRGVLIPISGGRLLLPNATVAEVITLSTPELIDNAPDWLLGRVTWRGWRLPLLSFSTMAGLTQREGELNSRVAILKALGGNPRMPFLAVVTQGFPRLTTLSADIIVPVDDDQDLPLGTSGRVMVRDEEALIPDMHAIEQQVNSALEAAAA